MGEPPGDHQWRLLRSHAGGGARVGEDLLDPLLGALHAGVTPLVRELGSLGTGDLTALAEIGVALGREGECWVGDDLVPSADALTAHGLEPVRLGGRRPGLRRDGRRPGRAGPARARGVLEIELNVGGENALMLPVDDVALPNGNSDTRVLTLALDSLRGAMAQSASLVRRA